MQIMDRSVATILPMDLIQLTHMDGVAIDQWQVYFPRTETFVDQPEPFEVKPDHEKVLFTGLKSGVWYLIAKDGKQPIVQCNVTDDAGTLYLQLVPGQYILQTKLGKAITQIQPDYSDVVPVNTGIKQLPRAIIDGQRVPLSHIDFQDNQCLVDSLPVFKALNAQVTYDSHQLTVVMGKSQLVCRNGKKQYTIDGQSMDLDTPIKWQGDVVMLPLDMIAGFVQYKPRALQVGNAVYLDPYPQGRNRYPVYRSVRTSHPNAGHPAMDAVDGDPSSYFASQGTDVQLAMDLGRILPIKGMDIIWYQSSHRQAIFSIEVSTDGKQWKTVFDGKSAGNVPQETPEFFGFGPVNARYVRLTCNGNTQNAWNSICEAMVVLGE
jgi:hypothetical protein